MYVGIISINAETTRTLHLLFWFLVLSLFRSTHQDKIMMCWKSLVVQMALCIVPTSGTDEVSYIAILPVGCCRNPQNGNGPREFIAGKTEAQCVCIMFLLCMQTCAAKFNRLV